MIDGPSIEQQELYRAAFVHNCLLLIVRARGTMDGLDLHTEEEPAITGLLVKHAKEVLERDDEEPGFEHLEILDDPPQNDDGSRRGKSRPRIDIEFVRTGRGQRPRFHLEAKRLYRRGSAGEYFGSSGLGMFLTGSYASEWPSAGMLGYVQSENCENWGLALAKKLAERKAHYAVCGDRPVWQPVGWQTRQLPAVMESWHQRQPTTLGRVAIYHLLLDFCARQAA